MDFHHTEKFLPLMERLVVAVETAGAKASDWAQSEYERRVEIRKRWPGLKSGTQSVEVFERQCNILNGEPNPDKISHAILNYLKDTEQDGTLISVECAVDHWNCDFATATAIFYFAELALTITMSRRKGYYELISGGPQVHDGKQ